MRKILLVIFQFFICLWVSAQQGSADEPVKKRLTLPNGWSLTPVGRSLPLGDLPLNIAVSKSKKYIAVTCNGQSTQCIELFDPAAEKRLDSLDIPKSWLGLKFSADGKFLYASGGNDNMILKYSINKNRLSLSDSIKLGARWPVKISPAGIEIDEAGQVLLQAERQRHSVFDVVIRKDQEVWRVETAGLGQVFIELDLGEITAPNGSNRQDGDRDGNLRRDGCLYRRPVLHRTRLPHQPGRAVHDPRPYVLVQDLPDEIEILFRQAGWTVFLEISPYVVQPF